MAELDDKTKQMLNMIDQDADSFAQRAEMYYKKRPVLVDMLGDLYRAHRSLAEQYDLLKHGNGTRHTVFGPSSCTPSWSQAAMGGGKGAGSRSSGSRSSSSVCSDSYDSESEVDDPDEQEHEEQVSESKKAVDELQIQAEQVEILRAEIERLKEKNAELQTASEETTSQLKAELAAKDEEKREVIRQLASSFDIVRKENSTLRERIKNSEQQQPPSSRAFDFKKLTKDLFSANFFTAHCKATRPMVAL
ncbi:hypothetical protein GUJ93_ZPchr0007g4839 [Zizania palustris]|uniref:NAB domain-containing protein n=1 Tax=Zizania palustris TaxID=103762 RepID=A0A8J5ST38_ZIZPA|nr:hypothetical protein GUJ93_ZPchr0007g4839 [Zizania palustris]